MASIAATDRLIEGEPEIAAATIRAIVNAQNALRTDPSQAGTIGQKLFPPSEAALIAGLIARDTPLYDPSISPEFVTGMNQFSRDAGILRGDPGYDEVVATQFSPLWQLASA
jgi:ABC-type nitrate/sulfonate/bicarbonate transport system substrate-binding protein